MDSSDSLAMEFESGCQVARTILYFLMHVKFRDCGVGKSGNGKCDL